MELNEKLYEFVQRIEPLKDSITTEEATKTSMIMPFFQLLGYDVFNPLEFAPEFTADVGIKKGEKVDYAGLEAILAAIDTARTRLNANVNMELAMELLLLTMKNPS